MYGYDKKEAGLTRALEHKSFHNVKVLTSNRLPFTDIDSDSIMLLFDGDHQEFGEYEDLLQRIETADTEQALRESFD